MYRASALQFISHIVQIKQNTGKPTPSPRRRFISHIVQIKPAKKISSSRPLWTIYIPYSSDKTSPSRARKVRAIGIFISHIVQIKLPSRPLVFTPAPAFISHIVQIKRWTSVVPFLLFTKFISHIVQIKRVYQSVQKIWKIHIYIPYSSDKTGQTCPARLLPYTFISHIVQIKRVSN